MVFRPTSNQKIYKKLTCKSLIILVFQLLHQADSGMANISTHLQGFFFEPIEVGHIHVLKFNRRGLVCLLQPSFSLALWGAIILPSRRPVVEPHADTLLVAWGWLVGFVNIDRFLPIDR